MKTVFNAEALLSVQVVDKQPCEDFEWLERTTTTRWQRLLDWDLPKECPSGWYYTGMLSKTPVSREWILSGRYPAFDKQFIYQGCELIIKGFKVYWKPYVRLSFVGGVWQTKTFDSYDEAKQFAKDQISKSLPNTIEL